MKIKNNVQNVHKNALVVMAKSMSNVIRVKQDTICSIPNVVLIVRTIYIWMI